MSKRTPITEAAILAKLVAPAVGNLPPEAARAFLAMKFDRATIQTIRRLLRQNNRGTITAEDRLLLEKYLRVGQFLDLAQAKARLSLAKNGKAS
jgi:hypothetical protein